ncbi:thioredoxin domain-containing protein 5 homolog [Drosophila rhopaloa]|uniref:Thioredoxin domain-containing protein n=1 Tax=Drosophila rhopaloa TaxID=1041015 RepID=A0ABM5JBG0_DRORH|nr:thioredoxin domain-containing protein 5 homolog [Drosophila rhopaloa]
MANIIRYFLIAIFIFRAHPEIFSAEQSDNITAVTEWKINQRSLIDCSPGKVFLLTPENFYGTSEGGIFFVKFYEPNCIGCQNFESIWTDLAKSFKAKGNICFAELNCEYAKVICNDYELRYEPNLIWLDNGFEVSRYDGDLTFEDVQKFVFKMNRANDTINSSPKTIHFHTSWIFALTRGVIMFMY